MRASGVGHRRVAVVVVATLAALAALAGAGPVWGRPGDTLKTKKEALGRVRRELEAERARVTAARQREVSILAELERMERSLARKRADLRRLDRRIVRRQAELDGVSGQRGRVAEDIVSHQATLAARLRMLHRLRHAPAPPAWFPDRAGLARVRAIDALARVTRVDLERLAEFRETAARLRRRQAAVRRGHRELAALRRAEETERASLAHETERRRALLARVREDRATHERLSVELDGARERLEVLVRALVRREQARREQARRAVARQRARAGSRPPAVGLGALRGRLPWPTEGRVVAGFGRQVHPRFGTETYRRGVDIEASKGAPIRAVYEGAVLYRGWVKGYGNLIVLDHGEGYYTLYAHASEFLVEEGQRVSAGQGIARVGETGSLAGPRLYFEVRYRGRAQNPEEWLKRRL